MFTKNSIIVKRNFKFKIFKENFFFENGQKGYCVIETPHFLIVLKKKIDIRSVKHNFLGFSPHCELSLLTNTEPTPERWIRPWL